MLHGLPFLEGLPGLGSFAARPGQPDSCPGGTSTDRVGLAQRDLAPRRVVRGPADSHREHLPTRVNVTTTVFAFRREREGRVFVESVIEPSAT